MVTEDFGIKPYITNFSVHDARAIYKKRTSMMQYVKMNYMNEPKYVKTLWLCNSCQTSIGNMDHVLWCKSYRKVRQGKNLGNDKDLAQYLHDVLKIRSNLVISNWGCYTLHWHPHAPPGIEMAAARSKVKLRCTVTNLYCQAQTKPNLAVVRFLCIYCYNLVQSLFYFVVLK